MATNSSSSSSFSLLVISALVIITLILFSSTVDASGDDQFLGKNENITRISTTTTCEEGSIAECFSGNEELEMDSEINRRILATNQYISYEALKRNNVPCSRRGASYYNCKPGAQANPYTRGCSSITRCKS